MPLHPHVPPRAEPAWRDLDIALATAASLQTSIRHADTKAATLLGVQGAVATLAVEQATLLLDDDGTAVVVVAAILVVALLIGLGGTTRYLFGAIAPRLTRPAGRNRFAFPAGTQLRHRHVPADVRQQCDEAWSLVSVLGQTAVEKHLRVRRSLPWLAVTTLCEGGLLVLRVLVYAMA